MRGEKEHKVLFIVSHFRHSSVCDEKSKASHGKRREKEENCDQRKAKRRWNLRSTWKRINLWSANDSWCFSLHSFYAIVNETRLKIIDRATCFRGSVFSLAMRARAKVDRTSLLCIYTISKLTKQEFPKHMKSPWNNNKFRSIHHSSIWYACSYVYLTNWLLSRKRLISWKPWMALRFLWSFEADRGINFAFVRMIFPSLMRARFNCATLFIDEHWKVLWKQIIAIFMPH